jgi:hypothetical protein
MKAIKTIAMVLMVIISFIMGAVKTVSVSTNINNDVVAYTAPVVVLDTAVVVVDTAIVCVPSAAYNDMYISNNVCITNTSTRYTYASILVNTPMYTYTPVCTHVCTVKAVVVDHTAIVPAAVDMDMYATMPMGIVVYMPVSMVRVVRTTTMEKDSLIMGISTTVVGSIQTRNKGPPKKYSFWKVLLLVSPKMFIKKR